MTNKEFFLQVLEDEAPRFRKTIDALPEDKNSHKVHDRSREAGSLAGQLATQWVAISGGITTGKPTWDSHETGKMPKAEMLKAFDQNIAQLKKDVAALSDDEWANGETNLGDWKPKKYWMAWSFLFDAIHHRGQLSTFLRAMGASVPAIYGPSADSQPQ